MVPAVTVITKADCDRIAEQARQMAPVPRDDPRWGENPAFPWEPAAPLDAPGFDCAVFDAAQAEARKHRTLDAERTPPQELAA